jgi:hypothetical protein
MDIQLKAEAERLIEQGLEHVTQVEVGLLGMALSVYPAPLSLLASPVLSCPYGLYQMHLRRC